MTAPSPEVHLLTGAYALDALDRRDRAEVDTHLAGCPTCAREVAEFAAVAGLLGQAVAEAPPPALRVAVLQEVGNTRQAPPLIVEDDLSVRRERRRLRVTAAITSAVAAVALVGAGVLGGVSIDQHHDLAAARARSSHLDTVVAAAAARSAQPITGGGTIAAIPMGNQVYVDMRGLPSLPNNRVYQLWESTAQGVQSAGIVGGNAAKADKVLMLRKDVTKLLMTIEPAGGSKQPTTPVIGSTAVHA
jgi:anti-sigma-K factor RskA